MVFKVAANYICVPATSVGVEQMNSRAKFLISPARNRLNPEAVRACMCLQSWYRFGLCFERSEVPSDSDDD